MDKTKDDTLAAELTPGKGIAFKAGKTTMTLPRPLPMRVWTLIYMHIMEDSVDEGDDGRWFAVNLAGRAADILAWTLGLKDGIRPEGISDEDYARVLDEIAEQLGEELADARPFSPRQQALDSLRRGGLMVTAMAKAAGTDSAGGATSSPSSEKPAAGTGKPQ